MLYWPIVAGAPDLSPKALVKLDVYMKQGGLVVFDTRDAVQVPGQATPAQVTLRRILAGLDIPELEPVPKDHVLGKAFYILKEFPGRFSGLAACGWRLCRRPPKMRPPALRVRQMVSRRLHDHRQ